VSTGTPTPAGVVARKLVLTFVGMVLLAGGITLMFESMRAVMDVGGYCASGGPYQIRQECPDGAGLIVVGIFAGLVGTGVVVAGGFRGGPKLWTLAWPALFLSLGWNFLEYGLDPPPPEDGLVWGWLICAVVFIAMGGLPLVFLIVSARSIFWGDGPTRPPIGSRARRPTANTDLAAWHPRHATRPEPVAHPAPTTAADPGPGDLVDDLERLAALHRDGRLTDDEYARAKDARLTESGRGQG
jgi:hypothetical protein